MMPMLRSLSSMSVQSKVQSEKCKVTSFNFELSTFDFRLKKKAVSCRPSDSSWSASTKYLDDRGLRRGSEFLVTPSRRESRDGAARLDSCLVPSGRCAESLRETSKLL